MVHLFEVGPWGPRSIGPWIGSLVPWLFNGSRVLGYQGAYFYAAFCFTPAVLRAA